MALLEQNVANNIGLVYRNPALELKLCQIFPTEIWESIFSNLEDVKDIKRCKLVSTNWSKILDYNKTSWLMAEVFLLIVDFLSKNEILALRLVCRRWRNAVDSYLCNDQHEKFSNFREKRIGYRVPSKIIQTDFGPWSGKDEPLQKFINKMTNHSTNPFIGRSLRICVRNGSQTFIDFLHIFGEFLENLEVYFEFKELPARHCQDTLQHFKYICECLKNVQNLKRLKLFYVLYKNPACCSPVRGVDKTAVEEYLQKNPIPMPPNMERIGWRMEIWYDDGAANNAISRACLNVRSYTVYQRAFAGSFDPSLGNCIAEYLAVPSSYY